MKFVPTTYEAFARFIHGEISCDALFFHTTANTDYLFVYDFHKHEIKESLKQVDKINPRFLFFHIFKDDVPPRWLERFIDRCKFFLEYDEEIRFIIDFREWRPRY